MKVIINRFSYAIKYLQMGWSIIPGRFKEPRIPWKAYQDRQPTKKEVERWLKKWPKTNLAVVLGRISGIIVLDIDSTDALSELQKKYGQLPKTPAVRTGRGFHYYFTHPGRYVKHRTLLPGIEIKGDASLVTLPPSIHPSGKIYKWLVSPDECKPAEIPSWLLSLSEQPPSTNSTGNFIAEGQRNDTLVKIAGFLRGRLGLNEQVICESLKKLNAAIFSVPLGDKEVAAVAKSIGNKPSEFNSDAYITQAASEFKWIPVDKLAAEKPPAIDWVWEPFVAKGHVTLLSSAPKAGKTTVLNHFLKHLIEARPFLGHPVKPIRKVLILTEEHSTLFLRRFDDLGLIKSPSPLLVIQRHKLSDNWRDALSQIMAAIKKAEVDLTIIDTLAEFWDVNDENDSQSVMRALKPLKKIVHETDTAVLLIHHLRKDTKGEKGSGHRGSSAITGTADINLELREEQRDTVRILSSRSRFWETPKALLIELKDGVYHCHGSPDLFKKDEVEKRVLEVLAKSKKALTRQDIMARLQPKPSETQLKHVLATAPLIKKSGTGHRGNACRYAKLRFNWGKPSSLKASKSKEPMGSTGRRKSK